MKKAIFIDYKEGELEYKVFQRIAGNFEETVFWRGIRKWEAKSLP